MLWNEFLSEVCVTQDFYGRAANSSDFRQAPELRLIVTHENVTVWQVQRRQQVRPASAVAAQSLVVTHAVSIFGHNKGQHESVKRWASTEELSEFGYSRLPLRTVLVERSGKLPKRTLWNLENG